MIPQGPWRVLLALPIPLVLLLASLDFLEARGPFWLGTNSDPAYTYLMGSLEIVEGRAPTHLDHPGLTVRLVAAAAMRCSHAIAARPLPLVDDVLRNPEWYIAIVVRLFLMLNTVVSIVLGVLVLKLTTRPSLVWLVQATPLLSPSSFFELTDLKPEPLLYAIAALVATAVCVSSMCDPKHRSALALLFGVLVGLGVASKFTAVSLAVIPAVVLHGRRERALYAGAAIAAFVACAVPLWSEWRHALSFLLQLTRGAGLYGQRLFAQDLSYTNRLARVLIEEIVFFVVLTTGIAGAVLAQRRQIAQATSQPAQRRALRFLWALLAAASVQIVLVLRHPYQPRYLLPALGLTGLAMALTIWLVCWDDAGQADRRACAAALVLCAGVVFVQGPRFVRRRAQVAEAARSQSEARRLALTSSTSALVSYYRASSPALALQQGNGWARRAFADRLALDYPPEFFLDATGLLEDFRGSLPGATLEAQPCVVFQGSPGGPGRPFGSLSSEPNYGFPGAGPVELRLATPWEAVFLRRSPIP
jgi:hypothetical protein